MDFFQLEHKGGQETRFTICSVRADSPWFYLCWTLGRSFDRSLELPIEYFASRKGALEDYPLTNGGQLLASKAMTSIIRSTRVTLDVYPSIIRMPGGTSDHSYATINVTETRAALHRTRSEYDPDEDDPEYSVKWVKHLVLRAEALKDAPSLFRLAERPTILLVNRDVKESMEQGRLSGVEFKAAGVA